MRIAVMGAGGVGGYLAARLATAGTDLQLIARGPHLDALRRDGLTLRSVAGDAHVRVPATADPGEIGPVDAVVFGVKSTDTDAAASACRPLIDGDTAVISFQNGVDNEERIAAAVGGEHVVGGVALIFSTIAEPGVIEHTGGPTRFIVGELDGTRSTRLERFVATCTDAGIDAVLTDDIHLALWQKLAFICAVAGATAAVRLPLGEIREDPAGHALLRGLVAEVCQVGHANGVALPDDLVDQHLAVIDSLDAGAFSSLHYDLVHGKPMELEALHGTVLRLAGDVGVDVPWTRSIHAVLSPWASRNERD